MEWINSLNTLRARYFSTDEMVSWKDGIMGTWIHYMFPPTHGVIEIYIYQNRMVR